MSDFSSSLIPFLCVDSMMSESEVARKIEDEEENELPEANSWGGMVMNVVQSLFGRF